MKFNQKDTSLLGIRIKWWIVKKNEFTQPSTLFILITYLEGNLQKYHPFLSTDAFNNKFALLRCVHQETGEGSRLKASLHRYN